MEKKVILVDTNPALVDAWKKEFEGYDNVEAHSSDIFEFKADAIVSPANSFGFMNGGIDGAYSLKMGWHVQERVQEKIKSEFNGELLVGQTTTVETDYEDYPILVVAPTMRTPERLIGTANVYLAARAIFLLFAERYDINSIVIPGLGTATGGVRAEEAAARMRMAYDDWFLGKNKFPNSLFDANLKYEEEKTH